MFEDYPDIITVREVAVMLCLPVKQVYRTFPAGKIKYFKDERDIPTCKFRIIEYIHRYSSIHQEKVHHQRYVAARRLAIIEESLLENIKGKKHRLLSDYTNTWDELMVLCKKTKLVTDFRFGAHMFFDVF